MAFLLGIAVLLQIGETLWPRLRLSRPRQGWFRDLGFLYLNLPFLGTILGLFLARWVPLDGAPRIPPLPPGLLEGVLLFLGFDLLRYIFHRALHRLPWLWRFHRVHHRVAELDWLATFHSHPFEGLALGLVLFGLGRSAGFSTPGLLGAGLAATALDMFSHSNLTTPPWLRSLGFVHPEYHRLHHQRLPAGGRGQNFSQGLTLWDRLLGTYGGTGEDACPLGFEGDEDFPDRLLPELLSPWTFSSEVPTPEGTSTPSP